jgi:hypothetical protein
MDRLRSALLVLGKALPVLAAMIVVTVSLAAAKGFPQLGRP